MKFYIDGRPLSKKNVAGVAMYTTVLIDALLDNGHEVTCISNKNIVTHRDHKRLNKKEIKAFRFIPGTIFLILFSHFFICKKATFIGVNHAVPIFGKFTRLPVIHDLNYNIVPETQTLTNNFFQFVSIWSALKFCKKIIFVSNYTKNEVIKKNMISSRHETLVIPNVPKQICVQKPPEAIPAKKFILFLGSLEPRKNVELLLDLFPEFGIHHNIELLLIGPPGWKNQSIYKKLILPKTKEYVKYLGYLSREEIAWYMKNCEVFCTPSRYEGFGIPQFEALLQGAKVVGSTHSELQFHAGCNNVWLYDYTSDCLESILITALNAKSAHNEYKPEIIDTQKIEDFVNDLL